MVKLLKQTFTQFSDDRCSRMAAALAYYTVFSLAPLLVLIITICSFIWNPEDIRGLLEAEIQQVVGRDGAEQVKTMLGHATQQGQGIMASVLSSVMLLVGATGLVAQLQSALNDTWEVKPDPESSGIKTFIFKRLMSLGMICGIAFLLLVSLIATAVLSAAGDTIAGFLPQAWSGALLQSIHVGVSLIVIGLMFAAMFKFLPDADIKWSDVGVGAAVTAVLFMAGKYGLGAYLGSKNTDSAYGAAGSLALILIWVYYSSMIFLFGAELTQVWAKQRGSGVRPSEGAVKVEEKIVRRPTNGRSTSPENRKQREHAEAT